MFLIPFAVVQSVARPSQPAGGFPSVATAMAHPGVLGPDVFRTRALPARLACLVSAIPALPGRKAHKPDAGDVEVRQRVLLPVMPAVGGVACRIGRGRGREHQDLVRRLRCERFRGGVDMEDVPVHPG